MDELSDTHKKIIEMWNRGMTSGEIANFLKVSRNSVIGKVTRMREKGISLRSAPKMTPKRKKTKKRKLETRRALAMSKQVKERTLTNISPDQFVFDLPLPAPRINIFSLTEKSCRFIVDHDPRLGAIYCGEAKEVRSYCLHHAKICFNAESFASSNKRSNPHQTPSRPSSPGSEECQPDTPADPSPQSADEQNFHIAAAS